MASRDVSIRLKADIAGFVAGMATAGRSASQFTTGLNAGAVKGGAGFTALSTGALAVGAAAAAGLGLAVSKFAQFDQAMSQVEAATHASAGTMAEFEAAALQAGASTVFSATEAAQGIEALAKAGVSAADILGGGLTGALDLAAAGELDVGSAAEIAATAMTQFNLAGSDVPHIADLLAAAAGKAQGEVTDMSAALAQSGLVASQMGLSIEETTGTLAAFASAGLIGSDAGTSFRTMLIRLANPSEEAAGLMTDLGISAYDAQGNFVGMESVAGQLRDKLGGLTQQQRDSTLATIFGSDAIRAANVLYNQGAGGIADWTDKVDDSGYAAETAALKTDNLAGDIERLGGAFDTALIQSGSSANDTLRFLTQAVTGLVDTFASLPGPVQAVAVGLLAVTAAAGLAGGAYGLAAPKIAAANAALIATGPAGAAASRGLMLAAKAAGIIGVAFAAASLSRLNLGEVEEDGAAASNTLLDIADSGKISEDQLRALGAQTGAFGDEVFTLGEMFEQTFKRSGYDNFAAFIDQTDDAVDGFDRVFASVDNGLTSLVTAGRGEEASKVFQVIAAEAEKSGVTVEQVAASLPEYAAAIEQSMDAANTALEEAVESGSAEDLAAAITTAQQAIEIGGLSAEEAAAQFPMLSDAIDVLALIAPDLSNQMNGVEISILDTGLAADQVADRLDVLKAAMLNLSEGVGSAETSQAAFTLGLAGLAEGLDLAGINLAEGADAFDEFTVAGANNTNALAGVVGQAQDAALAIYETASAAGDSAAGYDQFVGSLEASRTALYDTLTAMGFIPSAAQAIVDSVLAIPTQAQIDAVLNENGVGAELDETARTRDSLVIGYGDASGSEEVLNYAARERDSLVIGYGDADGAESVLNYAARGRTSPVNQTASTGSAESALNYTARDRTSTVTQFTQVRVAVASGGYVQGLAGGGPVQSFPSGGPVWGAGTATSDSIDARLSNGEFVNNAESTAMNRAALEAANWDGAKLMVAPGYAGGGIVGGSSAPVVVDMSSFANATFSLVAGRLSFEPNGLIKVVNGLIQLSDAGKALNRRAEQRTAR